MNQPEWIKERMSVVVKQLNELGFRSLPEVIGSRVIIHIDGVNVNGGATIVTSIKHLELTYKKGPIFYIDCPIEIHIDTLGKIDESELGNVWSDEDIFTLHSFSRDDDGRWTILTHEKNREEWGEIKAYIYFYNLF